MYGRNFRVQQSGGLKKAHAIRIECVTSQTSPHWYRAIRGHSSAVIAQTRMLESKGLSSLYERLTKFITSLESFHASLESALIVVCKGINNPDNTITQFHRGVTGAQQCPRAMDLKEDTSFASL